MSDVRVEVEGVWKRFHRGEQHGSLRDLLPAMARRVFRSRPQAQGLRKDDFWAVRDLSFKLRGGEALGIIGPNGAGKSTTLKILSRILRPNAGRVQITGRLSALIEVAAGFHPDLTGRENVFLNGAILGMTRREITSRMKAIVDFSGVDLFIDTPVKRYSSGMQARLGYAVAAHLEPDVLLVDEVLSVGDAQFQRRCVENMKERLAKGTTVIFISHNMPAIVDLCPRALVLSEGQCIFDGKSTDATARYLELLRDAGPRNSSGRVEITGWTFEPADGPLSPGDPFTFTFRARFNEPIKQPTFSLIVHRVSDQMRVYDMAMQECGLASRDYQAGEEVSIRIRGHAHLLRGVFSLGFNVFIPSEHDFAYREPYLLQFTVQEDSSFAGLADLGCRADEIGGGEVKDAFDIGVVVPLYNKRSTVRQSVARLLDQTVCAARIVVVDDGSTDGSAMELTSFGDRCTLVHQANAGPSAARNAGVDQLRTEWVAFADSDNLWSPLRVQRIRDFIRSHQEIDWLAGAWWRCDPDGGRSVVPIWSGPDSTFNYFDEIEHMSGVVCSETLVVRRSLFLDVGGFNERLRCYEITQLFLQLAVQRPLAGFVAEPTVEVFMDTPSSLYSEKRDSAAALLAHAEELLGLRGGLESPPPYLGRLAAEQLCDGLFHACRSGEFNLARDVLRRHGPLIDPVVRTKASFRCLLARLRGL